MTPAADPGHDADVLILGGGLAGLCLALQLRGQHPALRIVVLERHTHPVREAAFKVGESTVEIGAHYFAEVLGLREHLDREQIRKFGFRFFFSEGRREVDRCTELGVSRLLPTPSWQIDRGRFENFLGERARALGIDFRDGAIVRTLEPDADGHTVGFERGGERQLLRGRWLVDASGRAGLLKRKLDLAQPNEHDANAVWWRVDGRLDPNEWSDDAAWRQRCTPPDRWRSTNHFCGPGYWFWLIPLSSGAHSVGIVCDAKLHPLDTMNTHAKAMAWLHHHQPRVARALQQPQHTVQDFLFFRHFSYGCKQVFSGERWAVTGEAGVFLDPFYSPGSDFIALSNTYIADLIARDLAGESFAPYASIYQQLYFSFYENTLTLYQDQYPLFGDAQVMPLKVIWDYTYYWTLLAPLFFAARQCDIALLGELRPGFQRASDVNRALQALLREWGRLNRAAGMAAPPLDGRLLDQHEIPWFHDLNRALIEPPDGNLRDRLRTNLRTLEELAAELSAQAARAHAALGSVEWRSRLGDLPRPAKPMLGSAWYAVDAEVADVAEPV